MAFCTKCGTQLADDAVFCTKCGTATGAAAQGNAAGDTASDDLNKKSNAGHSTLPFVESSAVEMYLEGKKYLGSYEEEDEAKGLELMTKAAELGYVKAQIFMGNAYAYGYPVPDEDNDKAAYWYQKAAEQGDAEGYFSLAQIYLPSEDVTRGFGKIVALLNRADALGYSNVNEYLEEFKMLGLIKGV
jgi:TPR repeat protein